MSIVVQGVAWIAHATTSLCEAHARPPGYPAGVMVLSAVHGVTLIAHAWPHRAERIVRARQVTLLDSLRKRCDFARAAAAHLGVRNAGVLWGRAEALGRDPEHRERYDVATARAVAEVRTLWVLHPR